ncbi:hypothetical protein KY345_04445, partial [Candidatus Woesearchaeota archaeon]|nr:hypothetical protein [Candidatus Woesearchaeota archaeon]
MDIPKENPQNTAYHPHNTSYKHPILENIVSYGLSILTAGALLVTGCAGGKQLAKPNMPEKSYSVMDTWLKREPVKKDTLFDAFIESIVKGEESREVEGLDSVANSYVRKLAHMYYDEEYHLILPELAAANKVLSDKENAHLTSYKNLKRIVDKMQEFKGYDQAYYKLQEAKDFVASKIKRPSIKERRIGSGDGKKNELLAKEIQDRIYSMQRTLDSLNESYEYGKANKIEADSLLAEAERIMDDFSSDSSELSRAEMLHKAAESIVVPEYEDDSLKADSVKSAIG